MPMLWIITLAFWRWWAEEALRITGPHQAGLTWPKGRSDNDKAST
ncbi:hypothetical protein [Thauera sp.]|nr:hypothetical protein [Thauera sp.]HRP26360.1 hypothetical protein [Thauera sp.]